jgi:hypothetical protein
MYLKAYNSRASYLNGLLSRGRLGAFGGRRSLGGGGYNSRASYLNGLLSRGRLGRGLGQDGSDEDFSMDPASMFYTGDTSVGANLLDPTLPVSSSAWIAPAMQVPSGPILSASDVVTPGNQPTSALNANAALSTAAAAAQTAAAVAKLGTNYGVALAPVSAASSIPFFSQSSLISGMSNGSVLAIAGLGVVALMVLKKR